MEKEAKGSVGRVTAFVGEKVTDYVVDDREQSAARRIDCSTAAIRAHRALGPGG